ncbi:hypothetical protein BV360_05565 [Pseudomonas syringae pv. actinidiae]|nr:hypothetical protein BV340_05465 [Pseudomonas syringae pv. actinidiae]OSN12411.1 hypothetical protein BV339_05436 [Pseudomonas syringae pv. actinidiae]OSN13697.1 hypothetical protein BV341_05580 [Pseudomonas syringae pv. actinidiae]OSN28280.1 hypothetical protein BV343_05387 [Pseudomonas syringae pv. actinidiae]OSN28854.1 hypothetical protein BV342_05603 [Pseudomonas syringae pv. actinidiae]
MVWLFFLKPAKVKRSLVMQKSLYLKSKTLQKKLPDRFG